jgi:hypothetical protein
MHIGIGAAILILGVLFLATSKAGLKVLGVVVVGALGLGAYVWWLSDQSAQRVAAANANWQTHLPEVRAKCEKWYPIDPAEALTSFKNWHIIGQRNDCERLERIQHG